MPLEMIKQKNLDCKGVKMGKIIVVDDSKSVLLYTQEVLESDNHVVKTSETVFIASIVAELKPDLILMDVQISSISKGDAAVKALHKLKIVREHTKIILYSSLSDANLKKMANLCGADGYICKTDNKEMLKNQVSYFIDKKKNT